MRRIVLLFATLLGSVVIALADPPPEHQNPTPTALPRGKAEPDNGVIYGAPVGESDDAPTEADRGPAQKHFIIVSATDDLIQTQVADNASLANHEPIALDKRIKVPLVHDVQDDSSYKGGSNAALNAEILYLNWGAVTNEQLRARQGHYFTITWANHGPKATFVARFEYRQVRSKEIVRNISQTMKDVSGTTRSYFAVAGMAYLTYGPIYSWRFSILKDGVIVAQVRSFIW